MVTHTAGYLIDFMTDKGYGHTFNTPDLSVQCTSKTPSSESTILVIRPTPEGGRHITIR